MKVNIQKQVESKGIIVIKIYCWTFCPLNLKVNYKGSLMFFMISEFW